MAIPVVAELWEDVNFGGSRRTIIEDTSYVGFQGFNDKTSSIKVHPGPDYAAWKAANNGREPVVGFYEHLNFGGGSLLLTAGEYPNIHLGYNFGDVISSVRFNPSRSSRCSVRRYERSKKVRDIDGGNLGARPKPPF